MADECGQRYPLPSGNGLWCNYRVTILGAGPCPKDCVGRTPARPLGGTA